MTQAVAVRKPPENKVAIIEHALDERAESLMAIMPSSIDYDRFRKVVVMAVSKNPDLLKCSPSSIVRSVIEAAELGLEPTGLLGRAYLIPYKEEAQLQIGYMGLVELAMRSGKVARVQSRIVYEGDIFEVEEGTNPKITHKPLYHTSDPSKITHVYAIAWYHGGTWEHEVMRKEAIDGIRARSRSANRGPWVTDYGEMARKTVTRLLCKRLPLTVEALEAIGRDDEREYQSVAVAVPPLPGRDRIMAKLRPAVPPADPEPERAPEEDAPPPPAAPLPDEELEGEIVGEESAPEQAKVATPQTDPAHACDAASPFDDVSPCSLPGGHAGTHKSGRSTWRS